MTPCQIRSVVTSGTIRRYIGANIEEVSLVWSSVLRYRIQEIDDNEYPTRLDLTHDGRDVQVKQSGLLMDFVEEYGPWNEETKSFEIRKT